MDSVWVLGLVYASNLAQTVNGSTFNSQLITTHQSSLSLSELPLGIDFFAVQVAQITHLATQLVAPSDNLSDPDTMHVHDMQNISFMSAQTLRCKQHYHCGSNNSRPIHTKVESVNHVQTWTEHYH